MHHGALAFLLGINALRASEAAAVRIEDYQETLRGGPGGGDAGGGDAGGRVVATGTPADVAKAKGSATAPYLARRLDRT